MPIAAAVGLAAPKRSGQAMRIHAAMLKALKQAQAEGLKSPAVIKKRIMEARGREKEKMG